MVLTAKFVQREGRVKFMLVDSRNPGEKIFLKEEDLGSWWSAEDLGDGIPGNMMGVAYLTYTDARMDRTEKAYPGDWLRVGKREGDPDRVKQIAANSTVTVYWKKPIEIPDSPVAAGSLPETGDASSLMGWMALLGMSAAGLKLKKKRS